MKRKHSIPLLVWFSVLFLSPGASTSAGHLLITEVMAVPGKTNGFSGTEYWELTNFGAEDVSLHGYGFRDNDPTHSVVRSAFDNLIIRAGESVVFFRTGPTSPSISNPAEFRSWWGDSNLSPNLQIRTWPTFGFSGWDGDEVRLYDTSGMLVDRVQFGRARPGRSFAYEPDSGIFGVLSADGVDEAIRADRTGDSGSPGWTTGPVPVRVLQGPTVQWVDLGSALTLQVLVAGLPHPDIQWFFQDQPVPGGSGNSLTLLNASPADAGTYAVRLTNTISALTTNVFTVMVNTNPFAPIIVQAPRDADVFSGQTARFSVLTRGLPPPNYHWSANGVDLPGANGPAIEVREVTQALSGTQYAVRVWNALGSTSASARLSVVERPDLRFTEVMAIPTDAEGNRHFDWFEVTNFGTNKVDLAGWRFSDEPAFGGAFTITNRLEVKPMESVIFAERLDLRLFSLWWGTANLPDDLQVTVYSGIGLKSFGDTLYLWNPAAEDPYDHVATTRWAGATQGVSFECEHICVSGLGCEDVATLESVLGARGAFRAATATDIGSPGYVDEPPLRILSVQAASGTLTVQCRVSAGRSYRLLHAGDVTAGHWTPLTARTATNNVLILDHAIQTTESTRFYRVEEIRSP